MAAGTHISKYFFESSVHDNGRTATVRTNKANGIAISIEPETNKIHSVHSFIPVTSSIREMKSKGIWAKNANIVRAFGQYFNLDTFNYNPKDFYDYHAKINCYCNTCQKHRILRGEQPYTERPQEFKNV